MPAPSRWTALVGRTVTIHKSNRKREVATLADLAVGCALRDLDFCLPNIDWRSEHAYLARLQGRGCKTSRPSTGS
jgi:hypothetical protein